MKNTEEHVDRSRTLQELENCDWGEPEFRSSLVVTCHALRRKPLREFTAADLRIMIGQQISLKYLVPIALEQLEANPLVQAYYYPGDLLSAVAKVPKPFWNENPVSFRQACDILQKVRSEAPNLDEVDGPTVRKVLEDTSIAFKDV